MDSVMVSGKEMPCSHGAAGLCLYVLCMVEISITIIKKNVSIQISMDMICKMAYIFGISINFSFQEALIRRGLFKFLCQLFLLIKM